MLVTVAKGLRKQHKQQKEITKFLKIHCFNIKGDYFYKAKCLTSIKAGLLQALLLQDINNFFTASTSVLTRISAQKREKFFDSTAAFSINKVPKANRAKPHLLRLLFIAFIKSNRATNRRTKDTIQYWFYEHIK